MIPAALLHSGSLVVLGATVLFGALEPGRATPQGGSSFARFDDWFRRYRDARLYFEPGAGRLPSGAQVGSLEAGGELDRALRDCLRAANRPAADRLLALASFRFHDDPEIEADRYAAQRPDRVREAAIHALAAIHDPAVTEYLSHDVLMDRARASPLRRAAAAAALGKQKNAATLTALYAASTDPAPEVRSAAIQAAVAIGGIRSGPAIRWLEDPSPEIRLEVLDAFGRGLAAGEAERRASDGANGNAATGLLPEARSAVIARLEDGDWRVRDSAVAILGAFLSVEAIPALIDALAAETLRAGTGEGRKRVRTRIGEALSKITGADLPNDAGRWRIWWEAAKPRFRLGGEVSGRARTKAYLDYFDIPIRSDRIVFAIDVSRSMLEHYGAPPVSTGIVEAVCVPPADPRSWTKLERVKNELVRVIRTLTDSDRFQVVAFDSSIHSAFPALVAATKENRKAAERFVVGLDPGGGTAIYDALGASLGFGVTPRSRVGAGADTVFLLTDGSPTAGLVVAPQEILDRVAEANHAIRADIHTLFVGEDTDTGAQFMKDLARQNGGQYRRVPER